jgi:quercetin dioxygenase-like cupin family protein
MLSLKSQPYVLAPGEGPTFWTLGLPGRAKSTGEQTGGRFSLVEALCAPGYATPFHIHYLEDEALYVLAGEVTVVCGGETATAVPGSYVFLPRGIAHGFRVTSSAPARILLLTTPAGADQAWPPAELSGLALPAAAAMELETLADLAARYKIDVLGSLPDPIAADAG